MSNKNKKLGLGIAAVAVAGAGLVYAAQKTSQQKVKKIAKAAPPVDYRNTERGKYEKNMFSLPCLAKNDYLCTINRINRCFLN